MTTERYPVGAAVLHPDWPEARFNVSGMFVHHQLVNGLINLIKDSFDSQLPIEAIHGAPAVSWNAGRWSRSSFNQAQFKQILSFLSSRNVGYFPTFTNHLVTDNDLADPTCNYILQCISERPDLNGVIVTSDLLSDYIARKYPAVRQIASVIKVTLENGRGRADYYRELAKRFHRYVIHPDDNRDPKLLDQLDRDKTEILVNENCVADCPTRAHHYDTYAQMQRASSPQEQQRIGQELNRIIARCPSPGRQDRLANWPRNCNLTRPEVKAIYDQGFRHFKLQGRGDDPFCFAYDLIRYMLEPDFVAPVVHKFVTQWLGNVVVRPS
ncbi:MAG: hypothetical protein ACM359_17745 [Bacillota bacterium]